MKIPSHYKPTLTFRHGETWYKIVLNKDIYFLYRQESENDYTQIGTGNNPQKLEYRVYDGKLK